MPKSLSRDFDFDKEWQKAHEEAQPYILTSLCCLFTGFFLYGFGHYWGVFLP